MKLTIKRSLNSLRERNIYSITLFSILLLVSVVVLTFILTTRGVSERDYKRDYLKYQGGLGLFTEHYYFDDPVSETILDKDGTVYGRNDDNGVVLAGESYYNPTNISQTCIGYFGGYVTTKKEVYKKIVFDHADWLVDNKVITDKGFGVFYYDIPSPDFGVRGKWISAMAQGQAVSCLLRASQLSKLNSDKPSTTKYLKAADIVIKTFNYSIEDGGVKYIDKEGYIWYEEVAALPPAHILNGFIFSLYGLYDYYKATNDLHTLSLFEEGIDTLRNNLHRYDTNAVTRYDLLPRSQLFRLVVPDKKPKQKHPIDKIVLTIDNAWSIFDIGSPGDNDRFQATDSFLLFNEGESKVDWGPSYVLDKKTVRDYLDNSKAKYKHAAFQMRIPKEIPIKENIQIKMRVYYKDVTTEDKYLEVFDGRKYNRIGIIEGKGDNLWKINKFSFSSSWLQFGGRLSLSYHNLVIKQLRGLYNITKDKFFLETSKKWFNQTK